MAEGFSERGAHGKDTSRTLAIIKPDGMKSFDLLMEIDRILDRKGWILEGVERRRLAPMEALLLYKGIKNKPYYERNVAHMLSGPVQIMVLSGEKNADVIGEWRKIIGPTDPEIAKIEAPWTLRAKYGGELPCNAVHGSDSPGAARRETRILFPDFGRGRQKKEKAE